MKVSLEQKGEWRTMKPCRDAIFIQFFIRAGTELRACCYRKAAGTTYPPAYNIYRR